MFEAREGEIALAEDPAEMAADARLVFIGRIRSPWKTRADCPKNMAAARATGQQASVQIRAEYRRGLDGLAGTSHVVLLSWLGFAPRNLIVQKHGTRLNRKASSPCVRRRDPTLSDCMSRNSSRWTPTRAPSC